MQTDNTRDEETASARARRALTSSCRARIFAKHDTCIYATWLGNTGACRLPCSRGTFRHSVSHFRPDDVMLVRTS